MKGRKRGNEERRNPETRGLITKVKQHFIAFIIDKNIEKLIIKYQKPKNKERIRIKLNVTIVVYMYK